MNIWVLKNDMYCNLINITLSYKTRYNNPNVSLHSGCFVL